MPLLHLNRPSYCGKKQSIVKTERDPTMNEIDKKSVKSIESSVRDSVVDNESTEHKSFIYTHTMSVYSDGFPEEEEYQIDQVGTINLWLSAARLFCDLGQFKDASICVQEARNLSNLSPDVLFYVGYIEEKQQKNDDAMRSYEKALAIDSSHKETLIHLGVLYHKQKKYYLAEKCLSSVVREDLNSHEAWFHLGEVLNSKGEFEKASECFLTAIELEETAPVLSYESIKKTL